MPRFVQNEVGMRRVAPAPSNDLRQKKVVIITTPSSRLLLRVSLG